LRGRLLGLERALGEGENDGLVFLPSYFCRTFLVVLFFSPLGPLGTSMSLWMGLLGMYEGTTHAALDKGTGTGHFCAHGFGRKGIVSLFLDTLWMIRARGREEAVGLKNTQPSFSAAMAIPLRQVNEKRVETCSFPLGVFFLCFLSGLWLVVLAFCFVAFIFDHCVLLYCAAAVIQRS